MALDGDELETHYRKLLEDLAKQPGALGAIFQKATNKIQQPAVLRRLIVDLIGAENWSAMDADVKGDAYEGLWPRASPTEAPRPASTSPHGPSSGRWSTSWTRKPGDTICDPACGTGGFLLIAHQYILDHNPVLDPDQRKHLRDEAIRGN